MPNSDGISNRIVCLLIYYFIKRFACISTVSLFLLLIVSDGGFRFQDRRIFSKDTVESQDRGLLLTAIWPPVDSHPGLLQALYRPPSLPLCSAPISYLLPLLLISPYFPPTYASPSSLPSPPLPSPSPLLLSDGNFHAYERGDHLRTSIKLMVAILFCRRRLG